MALALLGLCGAPRASRAQSNEASDSLHWYRGNLHTHSFWSDGDDFPEMIADWYRQNGYQFLALSDHNVLAQGERWMPRSAIDKRSKNAAFDRYLERFGQAWVETRTAADGSTEVRLKGLEEYRSLVEKPGEFLLMPGEEISDSVNRRPVHMNATNVQELIQPAGGSTVHEAMAANLRVAIEQSRKTGQPILVHLNHPNFGYAVTAEDLAFVVDEPFFEVYNGHPSVGHLGKQGYPSVERIWDIANTLRIGEFHAPPLFGLGTDDSHNYHGPAGAITGRGWVMVRASELTPNALISAMYRGDFYASSGVTLRRVHYDAEGKRLELDIDGEVGVSYETRFIGSLAATDRKPLPGAEVAESGEPLPPRYVDAIGQTFEVVEGLTPGFTLTGDELYVRAVVTAQRAHPRPSFEGQLEQAWTQPVGWESRIDR